MCEPYSQALIPFESELRFHKNTLGTFPTSSIGNITFYHALRLTGIEADNGYGNRLKKHPDKTFNFSVDFFNS